jgi:MFS family permease
MSAMGNVTKQTFQALSVRNFRLYFIGQLISISGTWMQAVAQGWLVLQLTNSGLALGLVIALQFVPMLLVGSWGGLVVDRMPKRKILFITQSLSGVLALALGILVLLGHIHVWEVFIMAFFLGSVNVFDTPARQSFVQEMVGRDLLANAVSLNSVLVNGGRIIGPAIAGIVIATAGIPVCFFVNAASFAAVILALAMMDKEQLTPIRRVARAKGQLREGFRYAFQHDTIGSVLIAVGIVGVFAFNFTVSIPLLARTTFGGTAATYGLFMAAMGIGAVFGGLAIAHRSRPSLPMLSALCLAFGVLLIAVSLAPTEWVALALLVPMGAASIAFVSTANATLQMASREEMRGRVMALFAIGFLGSTPIGAPLIGAICGATNPRVGLALGGVATLLAATPLILAARKNRTPTERPLAMIP